MLISTIRQRAEQGSVACQQAIELFDMMTSVPYMVVDNWEVGEG